MRKLTPLEQKYLEIDFKEYTEPFQRNFGNLLNQPHKKTPKDIQDAVSTVRRIVEKIGGDWLRKQTNQIVLSFYDSPKYNAYAVAHTRIITTTPIGFNNRPWMMRILWNAEDNEEPVFEIGFTRGLVDGTFTEDELAFILAHELSHIKEGHTHDSYEYESRSSFFSSQITELAADTSAIELINGHYDAYAAYSALFKILKPEVPADKKSKEIPRGPLNNDYVADRDLMTALANGVSTHHHPGVRLGSIQTYLKYLEHTGSLAQSNKNHKTIKFNITTQTKAEKPKDRLSSHLINEFVKSSSKLFCEGEIRDPIIYEHIIGEENYRLLIASIGKISPIQFYKSVIGSIVNSKVCGTQKYLGLVLFHSWYNSEIKIDLSERQKNTLDKYVVDKAKRLSRYFDLTEVHPNQVELLVGDDMTYRGTACSAIYTKLGKSWSDIRFLIFKRLYENGDNQKNGALDLAPPFECFSFLEDWISQSKEPIPNILSRVEAVIDLQKVVSRFINVPPSKLSIKFIDYLNGILRKLSDNKKQYRFPLAEKIIEQMRQSFIPWIENTCPSDNLQKLPYVISSLSSATKSLEKEGKERSFLELHKLMSLLYSRFLSSPVLPKDRVYSSFEFPEALLQLYIESLCSESGSELPLDYITLFITITDFQDNLKINLEDDDQVKWKPLLQRLSLNQVTKILSQEPPCVQSQHLNEFEYQTEVKINFLINGLQLLTAWIHSAQLGEGRYAQGEDALIRRLQEISSVMMTVKSQTFGYRLSSDIFLNRYSQITFAELLTESLKTKNFAEWLELFNIVHDLGFTKAHFSESQYLEVSNRLYQAMVQEHSIEEIVLRLSNQRLRRFLHGSDLTCLIKTYFENKITERNLHQVSLLFNKLNTSLALDREHGETYLEVRNLLVTMYQIQPWEFKTVFNTDRRSITEKIIGFSIQIRYLSAICALVRNQTPEDQFHFIEYLMGRVEKLPDWVKKSHEALLDASNACYGLFGPLLSFRAELAHRSTVERAYIINTFICGHGGLASSKQGRELIFESLVDSFNDSEKLTVKELFDALIKTDGQHFSLLASYVLAQPAKESRITRAQQMGAILESFGVPGQKLAQYLAFTQHLKEFYEAFKTFQDDVAPPNHFDVIRTLHETFKDEWPKEKSVKGLLGSGTVNLAVLVEDDILNRQEVLVIKRQGIEAKTEYDFRRFKKLVKNLNSKKQTGKSYAFIHGLVDIIQDSVRLEFDKAHSAKMQKLAQDYYSLGSKGQFVSAMPVFYVYPEATLQGRANGQTARRVYESNSTLYKSAMTNILEAEWELLTRLAQNENQKLSLANPDLHDGQVLIDLERAYIVDFGQAVEFNLRDFKTALKFVQIVSGFYEFNDCKNILNSAMGSPSISDPELQEILDLSDPMERFVNLISLLNRESKKLGLPVIHWVLGFNRLRQLAQKLDLPLDQKFLELILKVPGLAEIPKAS